jgi:hypothetical protein
LAKELTIRISGVSEAVAELQAATMAGAATGLEKIGLRGEQILAMHTPVGATGNLSQGIFSEFHQEGPLMHEVIAVGPPADVYAAYVEDGTRPHMPPPSALLLWVKQKLLIDNEKQALSVAFAIARKIAKRGTQGAHMFDQAFQQLQVEAPGILERAIATSVQSAGFKG